METKEVVDRVLAHYGVKGMKWGVRRAEKRWTKQINNVNTKSRLTPAFHNETVSRINRAVDDLNRSDKYRNVDVDTFHGKLKEDYDKDANEAIMRALEDAVRSHYGHSPSGTQRAVYNRKTDKIEIRQISAQHADTTDLLVPDFTIQLHRNAIGIIVEVSIDQAVHSEEFVSDFLEHYGVKGMKWGVRRDTATSDVPGSGKKAKPPAHADAANASAAKAKIKSGGVHTLSNKELQDLVTRMNLEQQLTRLQSGDKSSRTAAGKKFAKDLLVNVAKQQVTALANDQAKKQIAKMMVKAAAG